MSNFDNLWQRLAESNPALRDAERVSMPVAQLRRMVKGFYEKGKLATEPLDFASMFEGMTR